MTGQDASVKQCCAAFYGSDLVHLLLGDSFHPGGETLTLRLGTLLGISPDSRVLDAAAGRGASAIHLAETFGCRVNGIDFSPENVAAARTAAAQRGLAGQVAFAMADAEKIPFEEDVFDAIVCECAFCTFPDKAAAAGEFSRVLKPGGRLGLSDLTRTSEPLPELEGLLAWVSCIGDAQPVDVYCGMLQNAGFEVQTVEDYTYALTDLIRQIQGRLILTEVMKGLRKLDLPDVDITKAKNFAQAALEASRTGKLGYALISACRTGCRFADSAGSSGFDGTSG
ncbi:MAG TPA: class I SAM-dependent methyltransferase [Acidobacteriaceae bacterium]|nr:class I SAM-dependent methyltransferase [Acidobacteriaceae bacterium]